MKSGISVMAGLLAMVLALPSPSFGQSARVLDVRVDGGVVRGSGTSGVATFKGIPYAAPPVGALRWRAPQPVRPWRGVRLADKYSLGCMSTFPVPEARSEDCLYLNVFTPATAAKGLPVIVWLHGAGYNVGLGGTDAFDGTKLARDGAVVVTLNYRLGVLGSLALPELTRESPHHSSGNNLHLDEVAALEWVHRNIAKFGGDPKKVLLMGQSSASIDVSVLQASPRARGLFNRVMGVSGAGLLATGAWPGTPLPGAEKIGLDFQESLGAKSLADLRAMPVAQIMKGAPFYLPVGMDGYFLPKAPGALFASGAQNDVPTLILYTRDEGFSAIGQVKTLADFQQMAAKLFGARAADVLKEYPAATDDQAADAARRIANDGEFGRQMVTWARAQYRTGKSPVYLGVFARGTVVPHGTDVPYWFGTLDVKAPVSGSTPTADDWAMSARLRRMIVTFARTGKPVTPDIDFPTYDPSRQAMIKIGSDIETTTVPSGVTFFLANPELLVGIGEVGFPPMTRQKAVKMSEPPK